MPRDGEQEAQILTKIRSLPPVRIGEVLDFIDFLREREGDRALTRSATTLSEHAFRCIWDNPDDADYDRL